MQSYKNIRTMTQLAIYDKHHGKKDRAITSHYRNAYVCRKNIRVRLGVILGIVLFMGIKYLYSMMLMEEKFFTMFTAQYMTGIVIKILAVLAVYTVICTIKFRRDYDKAQDRLDDYEERLEAFCRQEESAERNAYE